MAVIEYYGPEPRVNFTAATGESASGGWPPHVQRLEPVEVSEEVAEARCWDEVVVHGPGNRQEKRRVPSGEWRRCVDVEFRPSAAMGGAEAVEFTPASALAREAQENPAPAAAPAVKEE